jgi:hypothetical protein
LGSSCRSYHELRLRPLHVYVTRLYVHSVGFPFSESYGLTIGDGPVLG